MCIGESHRINLVQKHFLDFSCFALACYAFFLRRPLYLNEVRVRETGLIVLLKQVQFLIRQPGSVGHLVQFGEQLHVKTLIVI